MGAEGKAVCLKRALRLYLQQAPLDVLIVELKASAAKPLAAGHARLSPPPPSWTSLAFQERVAEELLGSPIAGKYPPRREYVARVTKVLLDEVERAGDEPAEGLLLLRAALSSSSRDQRIGEDGDTAHESFWFPRCATTGDPNTSSKTKSYSRVSLQAAGGAFFSFRVANRDNEVGLRVWEAGRALAEFCLAHSDLLEGKSVLELGAGIGMTGMAVAASCGAREVVLTDYAPKVLANLNYNVEINRKLLDTRISSSSSSSSSSNNINNSREGLANRENHAARPSPEGVLVRFLDWTDYCIDAFTTPPLPPLMAPSASKTTCELEQVVPPPPPPQPLGQNAGVETGTRIAGRTTTTETTAYTNENGNVGAASGVVDGKPAGRGDESTTGVSRDGDFVSGGRSSTVVAAAASAATGYCETGEEEDIRDDPLGMPEVVLAADVVYDAKYHPALVGVVVKTLQRCPDALVVFASTLRNSETMVAFHRCLEEAGVPWQSVDFPVRAESTTAATVSTASASGNSPPLREETEPERAVSAVPHDNSRPTTTTTISRGSSSSRGSASLLWCHPGDLERVKFCVCGRGRGLVSPIA
ncbi:unnamed protein product [Pylaiella littoralis]